MGNAGGQSVNITFRSRTEGQLAGKPLMVDAAMAAHQEVIDAADMACMFGCRDIAVIGDGAYFP